MEEIIVLFVKLSAEEKASTFNKISHLMAPAITVSQYMLWHQQAYGRSASFNVRQTTDKTGKLTIKVNLSTSHGNFYGDGKNQKDAKLKAVNAAWENRG
jgi:phage-related protein